MVDGRCRRLPRAATGLLLSASLLPLAAATSASIVGRRGAQSSYPWQEQLVGKPLKRLAYHFLHRSCSRGEVVQPRVAVFMIGLPGSGKSRVIDYRYALSFATRRPDNHTIVLDLDAELLQHPDYDPADPDILYLAQGQSAYQWADARVEARFCAGLNDPETRRLVVDGTGTNSERQIRRMQQARNAGFFVKALYVRVPVKTAIARAAMRKRGVKPERIQAYQNRMAEAMQTAALHADEVETVDVTFDDAPLPGLMRGSDVSPVTVLH